MMPRPEFINGRWIMEVCATVVWQVLPFLFLLPLSLPNLIRVPWPRLSCLGHGRRAGRRGIKCLDMPSRCQVGQVKKHEASRTLDASEPNVPTQCRSAVAAHGRTGRDDSTARAANITLAGVFS